jgi:hypothetical protein
VSDAPLRPVIQQQAPAAGTLLTSRGCSRLHSLLPGGGLALAAPRGQAPLAGRPSGSGAPAAPSGRQCATDSSSGGQRTQWKRLCCMHMAPHQPVLLSSAHREQGQVLPAGSGPGQLPGGQLPQHQAECMHVRCCGRPAPIKNFRRLRTDGRAGQQSRAQAGWQASRGTHAVPSTAALQAVQSCQMLPPALSSTLSHQPEWVGGPAAGCGGDMLGLQNFAEVEVWGSSGQGIGKGAVRTWWAQSSRRLRAIRATPKQAAAAGRQAGP